MQACSARPWRGTLTDAVGRRTSGTRAYRGASIGAARLSTSTAGQSCSDGVIARERDRSGRGGTGRSEERLVAVLFADMRGFTRLAETRLPYDVVFVLNRFRAEMTRAIESAGGGVNEFIGDGVMALFGLTDDLDIGCRQAHTAGRAMLDRLEYLNSTLAGELREPLRIGIGVHAGPAILGEMGYANLKGITVVGDVVNTASRLEEMTKRFGAQVVMSLMARRIGNAIRSRCAAGSEP